MDGKLTWWQMSFIGVGCIIGTGFFLGSSIAIELAGPSVLICYLAAGIGTYIVFHALASMTAHHPEKGSFRTYAKQAFGTWAGFGNGWLYWCSEMLIMGSQLTALAIFARFWFPHVPLWLCAACFAVLGLSVLWIGTQLIEKLENICGLIKLAALVMFLILAIVALFGGFEESAGQTLSSPLEEFFTQGFNGIWAALIFCFYAFGGIEVMGLMAKELKDPKDALRSGKWMLLALTVLYILGFWLVMEIVSWAAISPDESPFLSALKTFSLPLVPDIFNGLLIVAGFSTMVASLYAVTTMLMTLSEEGDAPARFKEEKSGRVSGAAFLLTVIVVAASVILAVWLPETIFEYITTAAGLLLLYNWAFILLSYYKLMARAWFAKIRVTTGLLLLLSAVTGTLLEKIARTGFYVSLLFLIVIAIATYIKQKQSPIMKS
ncbi:amino acid permease [Bacillus sp. SB49]|uniref:amino acid permease n=1 Tax=Bacillus sp. SB49 TaxID=1071080 RepID=UPI00047B5130|nr:amino acid permease [Bacillus sp. SB49]